MISMMDDKGYHIVDQPITVTGEGLALNGLLGIPPTAVGVVVFAHGSGSGRFSPRNNFTARHLQQGRLATLLIDLLTPHEAENRSKVFDIDLLADRVLLAKSWLNRTPERKVLASVISAPVPAPERPYRQRPATLHSFGLLCHGAADQIWPNPISRRSPHRLC